MKMQDILTILAAFIFLSLASYSGAADYQPISEKDGVEVMILYNPLGPNNQVVANIKFVNHNSYRADVSWTPLIYCGEESNHKGYGASFRIDPEASYVVPLWRSSACAQGRITNFNVEMEVKKAGP
jgi:hypothetical protein